MEKYKKAKLACYATSFSTSVSGNLSAILFITFRNMYNASYSFLGFLVLINFFTQLSVDLLFSFFSHKFNIKKAIQLTPVFISVGLILYALIPYFFPSFVKLGLITGTLLYSAGSGLAEVLTSPIIAAIPSKDPDREMSKLHSVYAWGVVIVIVFSTLFLTIFGNKSWHLLTLILTVIPLIAFFLFLGAALPPTEKPERLSGTLEFMKNKTMWVFFFVIFFGGASEVTMAQWSSGFLEQTLGIPKVWGDIFGVALFSVMLGLGRTLYGKIGKNVTKVLLLGTIGASFCYLTAVFSNNPVIVIIACAFTGFCVSMLWPGSLIAVTDRLGGGNVLVFALMAAGGDLGASVVPQLTGIITDAVIANPVFSSLAENLRLTSEQLGMKTGLLDGALFPIAAIPLYMYCHKKAKRLKP